MSLHLWLIEHHIAIGVLADVSTFAGALLLAKDAFSRLKELQNSRIQHEFRKQFPDLPLTDDAREEAQQSLMVAWRGGALLACGFLLQVLSRFLEP